MKKPEKNVPTIPCPFCGGTGRRFVQKKGKPKPKQKEECPDCFGSGRRPKDGRTFFH